MRIIHNHALVVQLCSVACLSNECAMNYRPVQRRPRRLWPANGEPFRGVLLSVHHAPPAHDDTNNRKLRSEHTHAACPEHTHARPSSLPPSLERMRPDCPGVKPALWARPSVA
jgi:hypothetical protein